MAMCVSFAVCVVEVVASTARISFIQVVLHICNS